ncbi:haloacid dehalogenase [Paenibacillus kribbensis]|uniref:Haloacid dehalogenase n=1 Tax=Paenibacillus kribbensis TaxID=172713 RepID=A0A222WIL7_9BACL|nr:HAD family hydrolase [Paenibacillus kribbensis]ASR45621.1 haloacid dehalogenase [Paenibacillus kribbensis]
MKVFVFDLDDTLYEEITFVRSGFQAVASYLSEQFGINSQEAFSIMWDVLEQEGRGKVFDRVLEHYGMATRRNIRKCLSIYRLHRPDITLSPDADAVLKRLAVEGSPIYIVTDGNKVVQYNKIKALGLEERVRKCYITYRYGRHRSKPSPYCFQLIAQTEKVDPSDIIYIGDNPNKDFVGIRPLGYRTIRIRRGHFKDTVKPEEYNADVEVETLDQLFETTTAWDVSQ